MSLKDAIYLTLLVATIGTAAAVDDTGPQISATVEPPYTCYEDEVIVEVVAQWDVNGANAFVTSGELVGAHHCVPVDDLGAGYR